MVQTDTNFNCFNYHKAFQREKKTKIEKKGKYKREIEKRKRQRKINREGWKEIDKGRDIKKRDGEKNYK